MLYLSFHEQTARPFYRVAETGRRRNFLLTRPLIVFCPSVAHRYPTFKLYNTLNSPFQSNWIYTIRTMLHASISTSIKYRLSAVAFAKAEESSIQYQAPDCL